MLNIKESQSKNECYISGIINELDIVEGNTNDGRGYIRGTAKIGVDQEIGGKTCENVITVSMFSMRKKQDGSDNSVYDRIKGYRDAFTSVAVAEDRSQATRVTLNGRACNLTENMWYDQRTGQVRTGFQIACNFLEKQRSTDEEKASFELSGVVLGMRPELDNEENETGRLIISFGVIGYKGRIDVLELIANDTAKAHIEANWNKGDTVSVVGLINVVQKDITWTEEQGFGAPIVRHRTESRRELIITGGSAGGLEEDLSYDADDIKASLEDRKARMAQVKDKATKSTNTSKNNGGFGF